MNPEKLPAYPSLAEVDRLVRVEKQGNTIPVYVELPADTLTPCMAYLRIAKDSTHSFLLESVGGETVARWSFVGADPVKVLKTGPNEEHTGDPMTLLASALAAHRYIALPAIPTFTGGAIGYVAYDCVHHFEPATARTDLADPLGIPEAVFMLAHTLLVFDHLFQTVRVVSHVVCPEDADADTLRTHYAGAVAQARVLAGVLVASGPHADVLQGPITLGHEAVSNVGKAGYETFVTALKARIVAGDIIQAVPSQRLARRTDLHPFNAYRRLRQVNPSPYMFYLDVGGHQIVGASPETLCRVERRRVFNHAIAGTIRRGKTDEEDRELARELSGSEKDRAEHIMLVDLARNDVNRVCEPETVKVDHLMKVEKFSHVMHLTSQVSGILREDKTRFDAFRSIFPAGTVSGAPKIKAIELVGSLEKERRSIYAGAVGRFDFSGDDMDTCIAIRTMLFKDGVAYLQAGGGIVYDSVEEDEYIETVNKLGGNVRALEDAERYWHDIQNSEKA